MLEKTPQAKQFESKEGVYEPYFIVELRPTNWEILPYANYTRLDGTPGREVRLTLAVIDNSKVNISQDELNCLIYLQSSGGPDSRRMFNYTQPVGFLLDWLSRSKVFIKELQQRQPYPVAFHPQEGKIILRLLKHPAGYRLQPSLVFEKEIIDLNKPAVVLTSNPIFLLHDGILYRIQSSLPAVFWSNFFRTEQQFEIPYAELGEFVRLYLPHILPVLDWENLGDPIKKFQLPLKEKEIIFSEENSHLNVEVVFKYGKFEFPAMPPLKRSLATEGKRLYMVQRDIRKETRARKILEEHGLIYSSGHWHIAVDYPVLDWMRLVVPRLRQEGFKISGEENLKRYRVHHVAPRLRIRTRTGIDWLDLKYEIMVGRTALEIPNLLKQLNEGKNYLRLEDGSHVFLTPEFRKKIEQVARIVDFRQGKGKIRLPSAGIVLLRELLALAEDAQLDPTTQSLLKKYEEFRTIQEIAPPQEFRGTLRTYQQAGLDWLYFLYDFNFGGILADDMGLGKTVQVIALLQKLKEEGKLSRPVLIVVPLTLIFNWKEEVHRFAPNLNVLAYHGSRTERMKMQGRFQEYDVILCSYGVVLQDQKFLSTFQFEYVILDESQKVKNPQTKTYRAVKKLIAPHKLALTGTPIENSLLDLWAQFNFVNPGMLGNLADFQERYVEVPPENREETNRSLKKLIYPFLLRRTKTEVEKQLPPLTEIVQQVEMTEKQRRLYQKWLQYYRNEIFTRIEQEGINKARIKIVEALTYLRQMACHPGIFDSEFDLWESGKIQLLEDMLEEILGEGHKVLIFSQFVRFLGIVRRIFDHKGWKYEYLDGKVRNRDQHIHNFQKNPNISAFLISLKAGGLGINLTAADYVIHLDPWWNPAVEQQATDRAHRIGQEKRVFVYKYIVKDSVEEKVLRLQQQKKELSAELITADSSFVKKLTREDLEKLFALTTAR